MCLLILDQRIQLSLFSLPLSPLPALQPALHSLYTPTDIAPQCPGPIIIYVLLALLGWLCLIAADPLYWSSCRGPSPFLLTFLPQHIGARLCLCLAPGLGTASQPFLLLCPWSHQ